MSPGALELSGIAQQRQAGRKQREGESQTGKSRCGEIHDTAEAAIGPGVTAPARAAIAAGAAIPKKAVMGAETAIAAVAIIAAITTSPGELLLPRSNPSS